MLATLVGAKLLAAATPAPTPSPSVSAPGKTGVCPKAPPGMQTYQDQIIGWVKWGVLGLIIIAAVVSIGSILVGRIFSHPHASRFGAMGLGITLICAILYVTILGILTGITGTGC